MGPASAYSTVLSAIDRDVETLLKSHPEIFTFSRIEDGVTNVRDFQTTGVVSSARGCPFYTLSSGRLEILGQRVQVKEEYRQNCVDNILEVVNKIF